MKKLLLLTLTIFFTQLHAQQEEYGEFLQNAKAAAENGRIKEFNLNFRYFVIAMDRDKITPEILTKENFDLFSECILFGITNDWITEEDLKTDIIPFLEYDIENHPTNMDVLGRIYLIGRGAPQDYEKAKSWFEKGAKRDDIGSTYMLGVMYSSPLSGIQDTEKSKTYFLKAAELGSASALFMLALKYKYGTSGYEKDISQAIELCKEAIEKAKDSEKGGFMVFLAECYESKRNKKEAKYWSNQGKEYHEKRAAKGDALAMYSLGLMYQSGNSSVKKDPEQAKEWFRKSCDAGYQPVCRHTDGQKIIIQ